MDCKLPGFSVHGIFQARILSGLPFPTAGELPNLGIKIASLACPSLAGRFFTTVPPGKSKRLHYKSVAKCHPKFVLKTLLDCFIVIIYFSILVANFLSVSHLGELGMRS